VRSLALMLVIRENVESWLGGIHAGAWVISLGRNEKNSQQEEGNCFVLTLTSPEIKSELVDVDSMDEKISIQSRLSQAANSKTDDGIGMSIS